MLTDEQIKELLYNLRTKTTEYTLDVEQKRNEVHARIIRRRETGEPTEPSIYHSWKNSRVRKEGEQEITLKTINEVFIYFLKDHFSKL